jgi:hypothetical protein
VIVGESNTEDPRLVTIAPTFLLLQQDANRVYPTAYLEANREVVNKAEYINSCLLNRLRRSNREIARLLAEHAVEGVFLSATDFQREVLSVKDKDETMQPRFATCPRDASMAIHSGKTSVSRPRTEGHLRVIGNNANEMCYDEHEAPDTPRLNAVRTIQLCIRSISKGDSSAKVRHWFYQTITNARCPSILVSVSFGGYFCRLSGR